MNIHNHILSAALLAFSATGVSVAAPLEIADYCDPAQCSPRQIKEMQPLADGESYSAISADGKSIDEYSYKTGQKIKTLFSIDNVKGDIKISDFDGYSISDNGRKILIWNNTKKIYRHSFTAEYYVYDTMRETMARVSDKGAQRGATLSHDGRMVAYTRDNNIFISNIDYGTDNAITTDGAIGSIIYGTPDWSYEEEFGVLNTMRWSSDDNILAFVRFDESEVPTYTFDNYKSFCDSDPMSDLYPQSYSYKYPLAGYPNSKVEVLAFNLDNRTTKKMDLPTADAYIPSLEFDGAGTSLMIMLLNRDQNDLNLYKVNPGSTVAHLILNEKSSAWLNPSAYQMIDYDVNSFVIASERTGYRHLYEYDYAGNLKRTITSGNWNVTAYYGKDKKTGNIYFQGTNLGAINRNVCSVTTKGNISLLNNVAGTESASFSKNYAYYVRTYSNSETPTQYTVCNSSGKKIADIELNLEYASRFKGAPAKEFVEVPNAVGELMNGYIIKPADFDVSKKYPLLMYQYNGPDSQEVLNRWRMEGIYYIASQGYIVAVVDGRGTGNRSREWANSVYCHLGEFETEDQIAAAVYFSKLNYVDSERMACFGWSYGGYMTLMEMSAKDSPFKAGIAMAPVVDWHLYDSIYTERYMKTPQQNQSGYKTGSALERTPMLKGNLLIMSGTSDDNVHFYNTLKYTSKLNAEGKVFDMMAFCGFEHSLGMCNARVQLFRKVTDFLNTRLK